MCCSFQLSTGVESEDYRSRSYSGKERTPMGEKHSKTIFPELVHEGIECQRASEQANEFSLSIVWVGE